MSDTASAAPPAPAPIDDTTRAAPPAFAADLAALTPELHRYALHLARDRGVAEELVQETILRALSRFDRFRPDSDLRAWAFAILRNTHLSALRRRRRAPCDLEGVAEAMLACAPEHEARLELRDLAAAIARLPAAQRRALLLVALHGLSCEAAAALCGCSAGTVKSRANRARRRLTASLEGAEAARGRPAPAAGRGECAGPHRRPGTRISDQPSSSSPSSSRISSSSSSSASSSSSSPSSSSATSSS